MSADGFVPGPDLAAHPLDIAVIGSGISGLAAAWLLSKRHRVTLYEREARIGGHSNTVDVPCGDGRSMPVDTGFIVYNERNYPNLKALFAWLDVPTRASDMSFGVSIDGGRLEYQGGSLRGVFAQPANLLRPRFLGMLRDILRFFRTARGLLDGDDPDLTLRAWLAREAYGQGFVDDHLLPMAAAIWSVPAREIMEFPARSFVQFFANHGLLDYDGRPRWRTVAGGSREYIRRMLDDARPAIRIAAGVARLTNVAGGVMVADMSGQSRRFDHAIVAAHADEALAMLERPTDAEAAILGAFRYQRNLAILHRDPALMPRRAGAWAAWNYLAERRSRDPHDLSLSVTYWMNRLQGLDPAWPVFVTLNPLRAPRPGTVMAEIAYDHPCFDAAALRAQATLPAIQGRRRIWFCGSYCGYGFHEDGLAAGLAVAERFGVRRPWADPATAVEIAVPAAAAAGATAAATAR
jgi:predicted NAD/FAD-binding protein